MNKSYQRSKEERQRLAESVEQRGLAEGNTPQPTTTGTQRPDTVSSGLQRVREAAHQRTISPPTPEAGAVSGSPARTDLVFREGHPYRNLT